MVKEKQTQEIKSYAALLRVKSCPRTYLQTNNSGLASFSGTRQLPVNYLHPGGIVSESYCYCQTRQLGTHYTCTHEYIDAYVGDNDAALSSRIWPVYSSTNTLQSTLGKAINNEIHFFIQLFIIIFLFFAHCLTSSAIYRGKQITTVLMNS